MSTSTAKGQIVVSAPLTPPPIPSDAPRKEDLRFKRRADGLLSIAQDVQMTARGTFDRPDAAQLLDVQILTEAVDIWRPSQPGQERHDEAVRYLISLALDAAGRTPERITVFARRPGPRSDQPVGYAQLGTSVQGRTALVIILDAMPADGRLYVPLHDVIALAGDLPEGVAGVC